jgi:tetratricopeptide (TPR) repeat protein
MLAAVRVPPRRLVCALLLAALLLPARLAFEHVGLDELEHAVDDEVARRPGDPQAHLAAARVHEQRHEWDAALVALEAAAERGADRDVVAMMRGRIFLGAGWPRMAKRELDRLLQRRPDAYAAFLERGRAWARLGQLDEAAADLGRAIATLPRPTPEQVIERRDLLLAAGRVEDAVRALDEGMARLGRVASLQLPAIDLEVQLGRHDAALGRIDALIVQSPQNPAWIARRGEILERAGRAAAARGEYARALALIEGRPAGRRKPFAELEARLRAVLAPSVAQDRGERQP